MGRSYNLGVKMNTAPILLDQAIPQVAIFLTKTRFHV